MTNPKGELELALRAFHELDAEYVEEQRQSKASRNTGLQRHRKNRHLLEEILASTGIDLQKVREYDRLAAEASAETYNDLVQSQTQVPSTVLARAQESIKVNQLGGFASPSDWSSFQLPPLSNSSMGNCGNANAGYIYPKTETIGQGSGWDGDDSPQDTATCAVWFALPALNIPTNKLTPIYVYPFLDLHGCYVATANDTLWTSKHAETRLTITTRLAQFSLSNSVWTQLSQKDVYVENGDEGGRIDHTRYAAGASRAILGGAQVQIEILVEAYCNAQGSGSRALMDFQSGDNYFYVPWVLVDIPNP